MAQARGDVIETPTQQLRFKAVIYADGDTIIQERQFATRPEAESFVAETLKGMGMPVKYTDDD